VHSAPATPTTLTEMDGDDGRRDSDYCARMDWPDVTHTCHGSTTRWWLAQWRLSYAQNNWRRGPVRPTRYQLVAIRKADWQQHGHYRRQAPTCPPGRSPQNGAAS
jgi:hypothetical protein